MGVWERRVGSWGCGEMGRKLFPEIEAELILQRSATLQQYQEQLAERVRRLQVGENREARYKGSSASDVLLAFVAIGS